MTVRWHPDGVTAVMAGTAPVAAGTDLSMLLVGGGLDETAFLAAATLDDLDPGDIIAGPESITITSVSEGEVFVDPVVFTAVTGTDIIAVAVFYDSGTPATSPLLGYMDRQASTLLVEVVPDGTDITVTFPSDRMCKL